MECLWTQKSVKLQRLPDSCQNALDLKNVYLTDICVCTANENFLDDKPTHVRHIITK